MGLNYTIHTRCFIIDRNGALVFHPAMSPDAPLTAPDAQVLYIFVLKYVHIHIFLYTYIHINICL